MNYKNEIILFYISSFHMKLKLPVGGGRSLINESKNHLFADSFVMIPVLCLRTFRLKCFLLFLCSLPLFSSCLLCTCLSPLLPSFVSMLTYQLHLFFISLCVFKPRCFLCSLSSLVLHGCMFWCTHSVP